LKIIINKKTCYALRIMVDLAGCSNGELCSSKKIAERRKIPPRFMAQIMASLVKEGLVASYRGSKGGIRISCDSEKVCLADIIEKIQGSTTLNPCTSGGRYCHEKQGCFVEPGMCPIREAWNKAQQDVVHILKNTSLEYLAELEKQSTKNKTSRYISE